jgi:hypothetical protein
MGGHGAVIAKEVKAEVQANIGHLPRISSSVAGLLYHGYYLRAQKFASLRVGSW